MRKLFALILALIMVLSFTGCNGGETEVKYAESPEVVIPEKGKITGDIYESSFAGIKFTKPENWVYATDDELSTLEAAEGVYYDMVAQNPVTGSQIAVMYDDLLITAGNIALTEEKYIESIAEGLSNTGLMIMDEEDVKIGDKTYKSVTVYGETEDISVTQQSIARKEGTKMISIAVVAFNDDSISDIMACFE